MPGEFDNLEYLYDSIKEYQEELVVCHEGDPEWRKGILADRPSLLSIRKSKSDRINEQPEYHIMTLNLRYSKFKVVKVNKESVRSMWAAQQQELVYYGNQNEERGSIQQMKAVLRNLVTQSCDLPVGYPIFISPLTTSYTSREPQLKGMGWLASHLRLPERPAKPAEKPSKKDKGKAKDTTEPALKPAPAAPADVVESPTVDKNTGTLTEERTI